MPIIVRRQDKTPINVRRNAISFGDYIKQLTRHVLASSVVLGFLIGVALLVTGGTTLEADLTFDFGPFDGLWFIIGLPLLAMLVFLLLSPLSFVVYRRLAKRRGDGAAPDD